MVKETITSEIITTSITKLMNEIGEKLSQFDSIEKGFGTNWRRSVLRKQHRIGGIYIRKSRCKSQK